MKAEVISLGLVEYEDATRMQHQLVEARQAGRIANQVLSVRHRHVYTTGRRPAAENILIPPEALCRRGIEVHTSDRGGNVTYHGPGQLVVYPILALPRRWQNVGRYVHALEEVMIRTARTFGVEAERVPGLAGVWVGQDKLGAIGVRISRWVTSHGLAFNVDPDLTLFQHIIPCGIRDRGVTSLARLLGTAPNEAEVETALLEHFAEVFDLTWEPRSFDLETVQVVVVRRSRSDRLELLCLRRKGEPPFWQPVTGKIEPGERPDQAARREVWEETGLRGKLQDLDYVHGFALDPTVLSPPNCSFPCYVREHSFALEASIEAQVRLDPATHERHAWLPLDQALPLQRWPGNRKGYEKASRWMTGATFSR